MLDKIKSKIAEAPDRQKVFRLLLHTDESLMVLRMFGETESISGNIWIRDGKTIVGSFVTPSGENGMLGMLKLLSIKEARFELADAMIQPQGELIDLSLEDLVEDENKTIATIKQHLWPSTSEGTLAEEPPKTDESESLSGKDSEASSEKAEDPKPSDELTASIENFDSQTSDAVEEKTSEPVAHAATDIEQKDEKAGLFDAEETIGISSAAQAVTDETEEAAPKNLENALKLVLESDPELAAMLDDDRLGDKRRSEMSDLPEFIAEDSSKFFDKTELPGVSEEELIKRRAEELVHAAGSAESKDVFYSGADPERTQDVDLNVFRQRLYESAKEIVGESEEKFYESPVPLNDAATEAPLNDLQKGVLAAMGDFTDKDGFEESHPALAVNESVFPVLEADPNVEGSSLQAKLEEILAKAPDLPHTPELESSEESAPDPASTSQSGIAKRKLVTQFDEAANLATGQKAGLQFENKPAEESLSLIKRVPLDASRGVAIAPESLLRRERFNNKPYIIAAAVGIIGIPLMALVIHNYCDAKAQDDIAMQREATLLAERSIEKESVTAKPQEPFRMPAGANNGPPPPSSSSASSSSTAGGISDDERNGNYEYKQPTNIKTLSSMEQISVDNQLNNADRFATANKYNEAVSVYTSIINRYPHNATARAKAAKALISLKQYRQAFEVCSSGLPYCQSRSDFDMLVSIIRSIP